MALSIAALLVDNIHQREPARVPPDVFRQESKTGIVAQISSPEERAQYSYLLAKAYAKRGDIDGCLQCLKRAKEDGYRNLANVYKDEEFSRLRDNPRLQEVVPPPVAK